MNSDKKVKIALIAMFAGRIKFCDVFVRQSWQFLGLKQIVGEDRSKRNSSLYNMKSAIRTKC